MVPTSRQAFASTLPKRIKGGNSSDSHNITQLHQQQNDLSQPREISRLEQSLKERDGRGVGGAPVLNCSPSSNRDYSSEYYYYYYATEDHMKVESGDDVSVVDIGDEGRMPKENESKSIL